MKVLIYSQNFFPEPTGIGKYSGEMAFWLASKGYDVRVICSKPYYPKWEVSEGYRFPPYMTETINNVKVYRAPIWVPKKTTGLNRILHLISFSLSSFPLALMQLVWRPNVVFNVAPAFFCAPIGLIVAKLTNAKSFLHYQDFEIDIAFRMGFISSPKINRLLLFFEKKLTSHFDVVSTISKRMMEILISKDVPEEKVVYLPNWVDTNHIYPLKGSCKYRKELAIAKDKKVFMFSGSMTSKQGLSIIPLAAKQLEKHDDVLFVLCGDGAYKQKLLDMSASLKNIIFLPLQPFERLGELLSFADVHLLPQDKDAEDLVLPSKLSGMLSSGRPIIATSQPNTQISDIVQSCGLVVKPGDADMLARSIIKLADSDQLRVDFGNAARRYSEHNLDKEIVLNDLLANMSCS